MSYDEYVKQVFFDHHDCMGLSEEEITDIITETPFAQIEKFLIKSGYDLFNMYYMDYGRV